MKGKTLVPQLSKGCGVVGSVVIILFPSKGRVVQKQT